MRDPPHLTPTFLPLHVLLNSNATVHGNSSIAVHSPPNILSEVEWIPHSLLSGNSVLLSGCRTTVLGLLSAKGANVPSSSETEPNKSSMNSKVPFSK